MQFLADIYFYPHSSMLLPRPASTRPLRVPPLPTTNPSLSLCTQVVLVGYVDAYRMVSSCVYASYRYESTFEYTGYWSVVACVLR